MPLEPCRECGKMVSTEAASCPQCGAPNPTVTAAALAAMPASSEAPVYRAHVHPVVYGWAVVLTLVFILTMVLQGEPLWLRAVFGGLSLIAWITSYVIAHSMEFVVTNRRVTTRTGIVQKTSQETLLEKVETVGVHQDLLGRVLNYGTVTVIGTGGSHDLFKRISKPLELRRVLHDQIDIRKSN